MRDKLGRFKKGYHGNPETEFKKGQHWRKRKPYWGRDWLYKEYVTNERSAKDIADQFGITEGAILFWLRKHKIETRTMQEIRSKKHWGLKGEQNGMYGKNGSDNPNWLGGITPERQAFYSSPAWKKTVKKIWKRDKALCQRCGKEAEHVHHIVSFAIKELRADPDNLILLCKNCHNWVHSKKNKTKKFIREEVSG